MTLTPAYGRDYKSAKAVQKDFDAGKDFIIADIMHRYSGKPANKENLRAAGVSSVKIRYNGERKVTVCRVI